LWTAAHAAAAHAHQRLFHRPTRHELDHRETQESDANEGRDDQ